jgi:predicted phosphodiesterase
VKVLVISDIHANIQAVEAVYRAERDVDEIWCAGDLVDYGTSPKQVIDWMRRHDVRVVQGNHDLHAVDVYRNSDWASVAPHERKWIHYTCEQLDAADVAYLASLPERLDLVADGVPYVMQHLYRGYDTIVSADQFERYWEAEGPKPATSNRRAIFGHTHRRGVHDLGEGMMWLNPGSVSYRRPDDPDKDAHYIVIEDGVPRLCRVTYDRSPSLEGTLRELVRRRMLETELQDGMFFFGNAPTSRSPLPSVSEARRALDVLRTASPHT